MRDDMRLGDGVLFYHSSCPQPGIADLAEVASSAYRTRRSSTREPLRSESTPDAPRWLHVDVKLRTKTRLVELQELRAHLTLAGMRVLQRGNRLSITPVAPLRWRFVCERLLGTRAAESRA